jgi:hypothetical protein
MPNFNFGKDFGKDFMDFGSEKSVDEVRATQNQEFNSALMQAAQMKGAQFFMLGHGIGRLLGKKPENDPRYQAALQADMIKKQIADDILSSGGDPNDPMQQLNSTIKTALAHGQPQAALKAVLMREQLKQTRDYTQMQRETAAAREETRLSQIENSLLKTRIQTGSRERIADATNASRERIALIGADARKFMANRKNAGRFNTLSKDQFESEMRFLEGLPEFQGLEITRAYKDQPASEDYTKIAPIADLIGQFVLKEGKKNPDLDVNAARAYAWNIIKKSGGVNRVSQEKLFGAWHTEETQVDAEAAASGLAGQSFVPGGAAGSPRGAPSPTAAGPRTYKTKEEVGQAFARGEIKTREEALRILKTQFGM